MGAVNDVNAVEPVCQIFHGLASPCATDDELDDFAEPNEDEESEDVEGKPILMT